MQTTNTMENVSTSIQTDKSSEISSSPLKSQSDSKINSDNILSVNDVQRKLDEFSSEFNSLHRLVLLNCKPEEEANLKFLLIGLKKSITMALEELGTGLMNTSYQFK